MKIVPALVALSIMALAAHVPAARGATLLFDRGHQEKFVTEKDGPLDLSQFAHVLQQYGLSVENITTPITAGALAGAEALVISGPFAPLTDTEIEAVARFVEAGGKAAVMLHVGPTVANLLDRLGLDVSNRPVHEQHNVIGNDSVNFHVVDLDDPLFAGLTRFALYGGWALMSTGDTKIIASTSPDAWVDLDGDGKLSPADATQIFGVVASGKRGFGRFMVFGDDAIFQNKFIAGDNLKLAQNLALWLGGKTSEKEAGDITLRQGLQAP